LNEVTLQGEKGVSSQVYPTYVDLQHILAFFLSSPSLSSLQGRTLHVMSPGHTS